MSKFIPCLLIVLMSQSAHAEYENYVSLGGAYVEYDDGRAGSVDMGAAVVAFGRDYNERVTFETRFGASLTQRDFDSSTIAPDGTVEARRDLDYLAGIYVKLSPFESFISPYAVGGYSIAQTSLSYLDVREMQKENSMSLGVGLDICGGPFCGKLEAMRYINDRDIVLDAFSASFAYRY
jgi:hypothetical protein